jgi:hypothetical protein
VLAIASAGWVFDAMEGQLYNLTRADLLRELVGPDRARQDFWGDLFIAAFLLGGTPPSPRYSLTFRMGRTTTL